MARGLGLAVYAMKDAVLHEADEVQTGNGGPYRVFTPFARNWLARAKTRVRARREIRGLPAAIAAIRSDPCPTMMTWALCPGTVHIIEPGERAARRRMNQFITGRLADYAERRDFPAGLTTSRLSQDLRFGLVSVRELFHRCLAAAPDSARSFLNELAWREFYFAVLRAWPEVLEHEFDPQWRGLPWEYDGEKLTRWKDGATGFPIVDAGMRELNATGFMHNRVRMITAMFLTKDLQIDWRLGERYFMQRLVDGEIASNNGGWQWSAGTGADAAPYFRIQNPWSQTKRFDPDGAYIKTWVPELRDVPPESLARPPELWATPRTLAKNYPPPWSSCRGEGEDAGPVRTPQKLQEVS